MDFRLPDLTPGIHKQLNDAGEWNNILSYVCPDVIPTSSDDSRMCHGFTISVDSTDRDNERVVTKGIDLTDHKKNPVVLLLHKPFLPLGVSEDENGTYKVFIEGDNKLKALCFYNKSTKLGNHAYHLAKTGQLRGASIGFRDDKAAITKGLRGETVYNKSSLVEWSQLWVPSHQDCVADYIAKGIGSEKPDAQLVELFSMMVPKETKVKVVGGFDSSSLVKKQMNEYDSEIPEEEDDNALPADDGLDDHMGDGLGDDSTPDMKPFGALMHGINDKTMELLHMIKEGMDATEYSKGKGSGAKLTALIGKLQETVKNLHAEYQSENPDQPDLLGMEGDDEEADPNELEPDEDEDDIDFDSEDGDVEDSGDELPDDVVTKDDDTDEMPADDEDEDERKWTPKQIRQYNKKALAAFDRWEEAYRVKLRTDERAMLGRALADAERAEDDLEKARVVLKGIWEDKKINNEIRTKAWNGYKQIGGEVAVKRAKVAARDDDDEFEISAESQSALARQVKDLTTLVKKYTDH